MKALFLSESEGWSGGAKQLLALADGLRKAGWSVTIGCPPGGQTYAKAGELGFDRLDFKPRQDYDALTAWTVARRIDAMAPDIVHAHHPRAHAVALIAMYLARRSPRFIVTRRVTFPLSRNPFSRLKYLSGKISAYVAVADSIRDVLVASGVAPEKVVTIPSGVDLDAFAPRPKDEALLAELGVPNGRSVVGQIANFGSWKGQDVFVKAAGELKRRGAKAVFLFSGRDTDSAALKSLAFQEGLSEQDCRFLGFRTDVPRILSILDVSVSASTAGEGLSGAIRESLAMTVPSVVSDFGGTKELVKNGVNGWVFPSGDWKALASAIESALKDPAGAKRLAEAGRKDVIFRYSQQAMVSATCRLYERLALG